MNTMQTMDLFHNNKMKSLLFSFILLQGCFLGIPESPTCLQLLNGNVTSVEIVVEYIDGKKNASILCSGQGVGFRGCESIKLLTVSSEIESRSYSKAFIDSGMAFSKGKLLKINEKGILFVEAYQIEREWKSSGKHGCTM